MRNSTRKYFLTTLGCAKNEVDSEAMETDLISAGLEPVDDAGSADLLLVNSCGFINDAKVESIDTVLELHRHRRKGSLLVVCGCLPARYEMQKPLPEVDIFLPSNQHGHLIDRLRGFGWCLDNPVDSPKRMAPTAPFGYLKISEGCDNRCSYCAIPDIKGPFISRVADEIFAEAEFLCANGVRELVLIGQDTVLYGTDKGDRRALPALVERLSGIDGCEWIRIMYAHPAHLDDFTIEMITSQEKVVDYLDLPIQHINDKLLKAMNRKIDRRTIELLIKKLRRRIPGIILRTTFIVGFPGETNDDFGELLDFCETVQFDNIGIFKYSLEEGTPAERFPGRLHENIIDERYLTLMDLQNKISRGKLEEHIGRTERVLLHEVAPDGAGYGRAYFQAPEIDGQVIINNCRAETGGFVNVKFIQADAYDLNAEISEDIRKG